MKTDLIFLLIVAIYIGYYLCKKETFTENFGEVEDEAARKAVRAIYNADIESIKTLSDVAKKLQAGGLTHPGRLFVNAGNDHLPITAASNGEAHIALRSHNNEGLNNYLINRGGHFRLHTHGVGDVFGVNRDGHLYNEHHGDHVAHHVGRGGNPYITLSRAGQWGNSSWYMQNVHNDHPHNSSFRIGKHDVGSKLDIGSNGFLYSKGAHFNAVGDTHIPLVVQSNHDSHIQLTTRNDGNKNVYLINRDGHFRVHHHGIGDRLEVNRDGTTNVNGNFRVGGVGMRTWILNHWVENGDRIIQDPAGNRYNADQWVVGIIGFNQDSNWAHMGGRQELYTFVGGDNLWYVRGELEGPHDRAGIRFIAYPIQFFDAAWGRGRGERVHW
jgi:hypothetical protein